MQAPLDATQHIYSRHTNPSGSRFEAILSSLLHAPTLTYASGLSALHAILTYLNPRHVAIGDGYHGSHGVIALHTRLAGTKTLPLECDASELEKGDIVLLETPVNPTGLAFNIEKYAKKAHERGAYLVVDSTFAPPGLQDPFLHGADVVMHSGTKYLGGHSDMLCGVLAVKRAEWVPQMIQDRVFLGNMMGGLEGWLGVRSVRSLEVRVQRQSSNAEHIVRSLDNLLHGKGGGGEEEDTRAVLERIEHASLQKDDLEGPDSWLRKQMPNGFGPVFSLRMKDQEIARRLPSKLRFFHHATSLGGVESLIEWRTLTDATIDRRLLRISVGLESWEDLKGDLVRGFGEVRKEVEQLAKSNGKSA